MIVRMARRLSASIVRVEMLAVTRWMVVYKATYALCSARAQYRFDKELSLMPLVFFKCNVLLVDCPINLA